MYYTGNGSNYVNCATAIEAIRANNKIDSINKIKSDNYVSLVYYLILALSKMPFHWG